MLESIKNAVKSLADDLSETELETSEDAVFHAKAIKALSETAGNISRIEGNESAEPFFTEDEAKTIADRMCGATICPGDNCCDEVPEGPCNVCWLDYLMEARK